MAGVSKSRRALYKKVGKRSLCRGKRTSKPNKCTRVKHCKVASGKRRTYCRKKREDVTANVVFVFKQYYNQL